MDVRPGTASFSCLLASFATAENGRSESSAALEETRVSRLCPRAPALPTGQIRAILPVHPGVLTEGQGNGLRRSSKVDADPRSFTLFLVTSRHLERGPGLFQGNSCVETGKGGAGPLAVLETRCWQDTLVHNDLAAVRSHFVLAGTPLTYSTLAARVLLCKGFFVPARAWPRRVDWRQID